MAGRERIGAHSRAFEAPAGGAVDWALYRCVVRHSRTRPVRHKLRYSIFMLMVDLEKLSRLPRHLRLFSLDRFNLLSLNRDDHGDGSQVPLWEQVAASLIDAGIDWDGGPIRMLFMPRVLGYAFNPLTVYYCHRHDESLAAILYEVHNTFGERHSYLLPVDGVDGGVIRQQADKRFYVSPFMDMQMRYRFSLAAPSDTLRLGIAGEDKRGVIITTSLYGIREPVTDRTLLAACLAMPLLGIKVMAGIHWEALLLWAKGMGLRKRPPAPDEAITVGDVPQADAQSPKLPRPAA